MDEILKSIFEKARSKGLESCVIAFDENTDAVTLHAFGKLRFTSDTIEELAASLDEHSDLSWMRTEITVKEFASSIQNSFNELLSKYNMEYWGTPSVSKVFLENLDTPIPEILSKIIAQIQINLPQGETVSLNQSITEMVELANEIEKKRKPIFKDEGIS